MAGLPYFFEHRKLRAFDELKPNAISLIECFEGIAKRTIVTKGLVHDYITQDFRASKEHPEDAASDSLKLL